MIESSLISHSEDVCNVEKIVSVKVGIMCVKKLIFVAWKYKYHNWLTLRSG